MDKIQELLVTIGLAALVCLIFGGLFWAYCCVLYGNPNKCNCKKIKEASKPIGTIHSTWEDEKGLNWRGTFHDSISETYKPKDE